MEIAHVQITAEGEHPFLEYNQIEEHTIDGDTFETVVSVGETFEFSTHIPIDIDEHDLDSHAPAEPPEKLTSQTLAYREAILIDPDVAYRILHTENGIKTRNGFHMKK